MKAILSAPKPLLTLGLLTLAAEIAFGFGLEWIVRLPVILLIFYYILAGSRLAARVWIALCVAGALVSFYGELAGEYRFDWRSSAYGAFLTFSAGYLLLSKQFRKFQLMRSTDITGRRLRGRGHVFLGTILIALSALGFQATMQGGSWLSSRGAGSGWGVLIASGLAVVVVVTVIGFAGSGMARRGKREAAVDAETLTSTDRRAPILYVRSFIEDGAQSADLAIQNPRGMFYSTDEERLVEGLRPLGPVVAIGKPGEPLPQVGAARAYVQEDQWRSKVNRLMKRAQLVVLRCGTTAGLLWEVRNAIRLVPPERLLIWLPPKSDRQKLWSAFVAATKPFFPVPLPAKFGDSLLLAFARDWATHPIGSLSSGSDAFDTELLVPVLQRIYPDAYLTTKSPAALRRAAYISIVAGVAAIVLLPLLATGSPLALPFGIALLIAGIVVGRLGSRHRLWPSVILGYAIAPAQFTAAIGNAISPSNEWTGAAAIATCAGVFALIFLPVAVKSSRIRHLGMLAESALQTPEAK